MPSEPALNPSAHRVKSRSRTHIDPLRDPAGLERDGLPLFIGAIADLSFESTVDRGTYEQRAFEEINSMNFDEVMARIKPRVNFEVRDPESGKATDVSIEWTKREHISSPAHVARSVPMLQEQLDDRQALDLLKTEIQRNPKLAQALKALLAPSAGS